MPQQPLLIETRISMQGFHCASTHFTVLRDREIARERKYPGAETTICCTPDSDYRCPACNSSKLQFAMRYASAEGEETGEVYHCETCGAIGTWRMPHHPLSLGPNWTRWRQEGVLGG